MSILDFFQIRTINFFDIVEILIIWFLIYSLFRFMRGRRTVQMVVGLFALFTAQIIADLFRLQVIHQFITALFTLIPIAIIVLFQDELRRVLASIGTNPFIKGSDSSTESEIEHIFQASLVLSRSYTGALIVIEGEQGLLNYIESGSRLDALSNTELLIDIFNPKANLHDGAVIISKGRIASAACIMPLTRSQNVAKQYGTRHRAAIGISEETDCIVVIVSEETSKISFAQGGRIFTLKDHSLPQLLETYHNLLLPESDESRMESLRSFTRKPFRKRRHGKSRKKEELE